MREASKILIVGSGGRLGSALLRVFGRDFVVKGLTRGELDLATGEGMTSVLEPLDFDLLINCAAQTNVDRCEREPAEAFALNAEAPRILAQVCSRKGARLIHISTDYVFDGQKTEPYTEEDDAVPISVYGESKLEGERHVLADSDHHLVARVSWVFGPDRPSFVDWVIEQALTKDAVEAVCDKFSTPSGTSDLANLLRPLLRSSLGGIIHLSNGGACSWQQYGQWAVDCCQAEGLSLRAHTVGATTLADMKQFLARRPVYTVLSTAKYARITGASPRPWQEAVHDYVRESVVPRLRRGSVKA